MQTGDDEFLEVAVRSGLLDEKTCEHIKTVASDRGVAASRAAMDEGTLSPEQVEVVDSLLRPRQVVAGYEILSLLGQGGMGVVYRARQMAFDRVVALKMVRLGDAKLAPLARFEQEAKTIGRFAHPHIVTAFDFGRTNGRLYLAMEYLQGQDASNYLVEHGPLPELAAWSVIRQAAAGLLYAADHSVTHRDIKPANLLLIDPPAGIEHPAGVPFVKIADFGLALLHEGNDDQTRLTTAHSTLGSPQYMAPEQLEGSHVDARADIYALGATAFHLLSGKPPFHGLPLQQLYSRKLSGEPKSLAELRPDISQASLAAVATLMARDPAARPANHRAVLQLADSVIRSLKGDSGPMAAQTPSSVAANDASPTVPLVTRRRNLWGILLCAGAVILTVVFGAFFLVPPTPKHSVNWVPTGWSVECFDGLSLNGWRTVRGQWTPGQKDEEGGRVLGGRGILACDLAKLSGRNLESLSGFRLVALGQLHQAETIELQLATTSKEEGADPAVLAVQLSKDHVRWGSRRRAEGPLDKIVSERRVVASDDHFHEFRIDCEAGQLKVFFDGDLLATQAVPTPAASEFRLAASSGSANESASGWFSDVVLEELAAPSEASKGK